MWRCPNPYSTIESVFVSSLGLCRPWIAFHSPQLFLLILLCSEVDDNMWTDLYSSFKMRNRCSVFALHS